MININTVEEAIKDIRQGKIIIVADDEDRENECDFIASAQLCTAETINFMAVHGRGLICLPSDESIINKLELPQMAENNTDNHCTAFTVSVDHISATTGISAAERAQTAVRFADESSKPSDFRRPGHLFPLRARPKGVLERNGHTEATVDLCRLAGLSPCGLCCEIMNDDGSMARLKDIGTLQQKYNLKLITVADLIDYIKKKTLKAEISTMLYTKYGEFHITAYSDAISGKEHIALHTGDIADGRPVLCRIHSECLTGDALGSVKCDCGQQYDEAMKRIANEGRGILIYMRQEGRGIGLINKLKAYELQRQGMDTVEANIALGFPDDMRKYDRAAEILRDLGVNRIQLMTNNPDKVNKLKALGIEITERIPIIVKHSHEADFYMYTKQEKMGHILNIREVKQNEKN